MSEEAVNVQQDNESQQGTPEAQNDADVDYKALYFTEVSNAKKLRKRSQEAEAMVQKNAKQQEAFKVSQMKEQEQFKELSEELQSKLDSVTPFKEKWEAYEANKRESLLSKLPEGDREGLKDENLKTLEYIVSMKETSKPFNPEHKAGVQRNVSDKPYAQMSEAERKTWHENTFNSIKK